MSGKASKQSARNQTIERGLRDSQGNAEFLTKVWPPGGPAPRLLGTKGRLTLAFVAALLLGFNLYFPALSGPFVFDDFTLPYHRTLSDAPLSSWLGMAGVRPLLIITYWLN